VNKNGLVVEGEEVNKSKSSSGDNQLDIPPGFGQLVGAKTDGGLVNSGVGLPYSYEASSYRKRNSTKQPHVQPTKRVRRGQTTQSKGSVLRRQSIEKVNIPVTARKEGCLLEGDSAETTESMMKMASEAVEMGEVLGIKVIGNRENALKRITSSLKTKRV